MGRKSFNIFITALLCVCFFREQGIASAGFCSDNASFLWDTAQIEGSYQKEDTGSDLIFRFEKYLRSQKYKEALILAGRIETLIRTGNLSAERKIYITYLLGVCYSANEINDKAKVVLNQTLELLNLHPVDSMYIKVLYNLGVNSIKMGDFIRSESYFMRSFEIKIKNLKKDDPELAADYFNRAVANINLRNFEKGLDLSSRGLEIVNNKPDSVPMNIIAYLYETKGTALSMLSDYHQSILYYNKALSFFDDGLPKEIPFYLNTLSNTISSYYFLDQLDPCTDYFKKGESIKSLSGTAEMFNLFFNYASILAERNMKQKGVVLLSEEIKRIKQKSGADTRLYNYALQNFADFLLEHKINPAKSRELYLEVYKYLRNHPWDISLRIYSAIGYAQAIAEEGNYNTALDSVRSVLFNEAGLPVPSDYFTNPPDSLLKPDKISFEILSAKFKILQMLSLKEKDLSVIESAARTAELMIFVIEQMRLSIGEEQSRLLLGNKYRESYLNVIQGWSDCYSLTQNPIYLEKAFEYSEKSKASSLLAFMREKKALNGVIPARLAEMEREAENMIGISMKSKEQELTFEEPDSLKLELWNDIIISATNTRDSLKKEFARNYPQYYALKYDTRVVSISDIRKLTGSKRNYLSYVVSDSCIYIMVANSEHAQIVKVSIDSAFSDAVLRYRSLLSSPDRGVKAADEFISFQRDGNFLYSILIQPVIQYLISDELIISPDNKLAYFPFETLVTSDDKRTDLQYRTLPYLMKDFRISYAYSATLLSESARTKRAFRNRLIAFAPSYQKPVDVDSIWVNRQEIRGLLPELKYAPEEAGFVSRITSGKLFGGSAATKKLFTRMAGKFDIIHLAMHTVLNNNDPANSGMIFTDSASLGDNKLRPSEIYAIRMNAKMVVLSSCYTGDGKLFAGEGVLSIARGFIFAGSRSVVMSLWEVDDRSGTELIKSFYRKLKSGRSKSESLRKARIEYLENADMLHSHPYFWSTMVIYGDDSPVYLSLFVRMMYLMIPMLLIFFVFYYFMKR